MQMKHNSWLHNHMTQSTLDQSIIEKENILQLNKDVGSSFLHCTLTFSLLFYSSLILF